MLVYIVAPHLTLTNHPLAEKFSKLCMEEIERYVSAVPVQNPSSLYTCNPEKESVILFFSNDDGQYDPSVLALLERGAHAGTSLFAIAMDADSRQPPKVAAKSQSFDVTEQLRNRCLTEEYIHTVAAVLARTVVAHLQPTLCKNRMHLFISHRRLDGETIAARLWQQLRSRAESAFRDIVDIQIGEDAQEVIEENLRQSDAVLFLDTPRARESLWVEKELQMALSLNIPIVWVKIGEEANRIASTVKVADNPHFLLPAITEENPDISSEKLDEMINYAFSLSRKTAEQVFSHLHQLELLSQHKHITVEALDRRQMLYRVKVPRDGFRYPQRPMTHLIQLFGRFPKDCDRQNFFPFLRRVGYIEHPQEGIVYDSAILLAPIPAQDYTYTTSPTLCTVDSFGDYVSCLEQYTVSALGNIQGKGVIISGAFPDCSPEHQYHLNEAIYAFTEAILTRGGTVIFGGHPTFQPLIFGLAKRLRPNDYDKLIHLYVSHHYVSQNDVTAFENEAVVLATKNTGDRQGSLTIMRKAMIQDETAVGLIALGGKTPSANHSPGIDEEIKLAREAGLPVFLIGSVGGRSAELAVEQNKRGWKPGWNSLTEEENQFLMYSLDFTIMARQILDRLGI